MRRRGAALLLAGALLLTGCAAADGDDFPADQARPVDSTQAQVLATVRFRNFDAGTRAISFTIPEGSAKGAFTGWFDYDDGTGYGAFTADDATTLLLWNDEVVGSYLGDTAASDAAPLPVPGVDRLSEDWTGGALSPTSSTRDAVLAVIASLGSDRPDNPLLLQQSGALWLGERTLDGAPVTVFAGPPSDAALGEGETADPAAASIRYWIDDAGTTRRVDARVGGDWVAIAFADSDTDLGDPFDTETPK